PLTLIAHPSQVFSPSGYSWSGGFICGALALVFLSRWLGIPVLMLTDLASPSAALVYAVARIGCLLAGDGDYGNPTSLPWGMSFPHGVIPTYVSVHPTPLYESISGLLIFGYLWRRLARSNRSGSTLARYLVLSGIARFLAEFTRANPRSILGLTRP